MSSCETEALPEWRIELNRDIREGRERAAKEEKAMRVQRCREQHEGPYAAEFCELPVRCRKAMVTIGVRSFAELQSFSREDLLEIRNFGYESLRLVKEALSKRGMSLKQEAKPNAEIVWLAHKYLNAKAKLGAALRDLREAIEDDEIESAMRKYLRAEGRVERLLKQLREAAN
jgi:hypothetical protein